MSFVIDTTWFAFLLLLPSIVVIFTVLVVELASLRLARKAAKHVTRCCADDRSNNF